MAAFLPQIPHAPPWNAKLSHVPFFFTFHLDAHLLQFYVFTSCKLKPHRRETFFLKRKYFLTYSRDSPFCRKTKSSLPCYENSETFRILNQIYPVQFPLLSPYWLNIAFTYGLLSGLFPFTILLSPYVLHVLPI